MNKSDYFILPFRRKLKNVKILKHIIGEKLSFHPLFIGRKAKRSLWTSFPSHQQIAVHTVPRTLLPNFACTLISFLESFYKFPVGII